MFALGLFCLLFLHQEGAALEHFYTHPARIGANTSIPCKFDVSAVPSAQRTLSILWHFQGKEIFRYPNNPTAPTFRLSIDQDRIKDGIADLYMSDVSIADGGLYKCFMLQTPEKKEKEIRLDVYAAPRITITEKNVVIAKKSVLSCDASEYYPVDIDIKWLRDGVLLNNITVEKPLRNLDGTYSGRSSVTIIPSEEDRERIFSCRVQHESLSTPIQEDFQLVFEDTHNLTVIIISVIAVIAVLIIIIIVPVIIVCKRKGKNNPNEADNLESQIEILMPRNREHPGRINTAGNRGRDKSSSSGNRMTKSSGQQETNPSTHKEMQIKSECGGVIVADIRQRFEREP